MQKVYLWMAAALLLAGCAAGPRSSDGGRAELTLLTEEYAPLNFTKDGKVTGQVTEVVEELLKRSGTGATIRSVPWEEGYRAVLERPDTALFSTAMTRERKGLLQWVGPVTALDSNFYARKGSGITIRTLDDAKKAGRIVTVVDYYTEEFLRKEGFTNLRSQPSDHAALQKLLRGEAELYIGTNIAMPALLEKVGAAADAVEKVFTVSSDLAYIAFSRETPHSLVARWQKELDGMKRDGSFDRIYARWFPGETPPGTFQMMTEEYPPITFMKDGKPSGFVTEMVREIAARLNVPENIRLTSWKNAYNMALLHPNVILFSAERTLEREPRFRWVGPVGKNSAILYARKGSGIRLDSLEEARRVGTIATTTDWFTEQYLKREGFTNLVSSRDPAENVRQLMEGEVRLSIFTDLTIPEIAKNAGYSMDDLEPVYTVSRTYFYIALSKDTPADVARAWQSALDALKKDGTFESIYRRYLPDAELDDLLR
jgi:polar amino acid transport system substrate-binding protein